MLNQIDAESPTDIFDRARDYGRANELAYAGAVTPSEAHWLARTGNARIVDVRGRFEREFVGRVPDSVPIEWRVYEPDGANGIRSHLNPGFMAQLEDAFDQDDALLLLCRSALRSHQAAVAAAAAGFTRVYNVLEGFEGDLDAGKQRGQAGGWRKSGLPWLQG